MTDSVSVPVPHFDRMIKGIVSVNAVLAVAAVLVGFLATRSVDLVLGIVIGAVLATANAALLARKLKVISAMPDPSAGQLSMMAGMVVRFLMMGAGMAAAVFLLKLDKFGIGGLLGAIVLFQLISGWFASRSALSSRSGPAET